MKQASVLLSLSLVGAASLSVVASPGCGPQPASPPSPAPRPLASPVPLKIAPAQQSGAPPAVAPEPPPIATAPLFVLAEIESFFSLSINVVPTAQKGAGDAPPRVVLLQASSFLAELHATEIRQPADLLVGMPEYLNFGSPAIVNAAGTYPDNVFVRVIPGARRRGAGAILKRQKDRWISAGGSQEGFETSSLYDVGGHVISLRAAWNGAMSLASLTGGGLADLPSFTSQGAAPSSAISILPTGYVFELVHAEGSAFGMGVARWSPKAKAPQTDKLPWPTGADPKAHELSSILHVRAPDDAYYAAGVGRGDGSSNGYLAHFDGTKWVADAPPNDEWVTSIAVAQDGATWLVTSTREDHHQRLHRRPRGGSAWEELALPPPIFSTKATAPKLSVEEVYEVGPDILVTARYTDSEDPDDLGAARSVVLRTSPVKRPILVRGSDFPTIDELEETPGAPPAITRGAPPGPGSPACSSVFLLLGTPGMTSVINALRELPAASGLTLVETNGGKQSYLGVTARSFEEGDALKKHVSERVPEAKPKLLCGAPSVKRRVLIP